MSSLETPQERVQIASELAADIQQAIEAFEPPNGCKLVFVDPGALRYPKELATNPFIQLKEFAKFSPEEIKVRLKVRATDSLQRQIYIRCQGKKELKLTRLIGMAADDPGREGDEEKGIPPTPPNIGWVFYLTTET